MAKIDDILEPRHIKVSNTELPMAEHDYQVMVQDSYISHIKQALYTDLMELIGEDEQGTWTDRVKRETHIRVFSETRNEYRAELRAKLREYLGIEDENI